MSSHRSRNGWPPLAAFLWLLVIVPRVKAQQAIFEGHIVDENGVPVDNAEVVILSPKGAQQAAYSNAAGDLNIPNLYPGAYRVSVSKPGFFLLKDQAVELKAGTNEVAFTLSHEFEVHASVEVLAPAAQVDPQQTVQSRTLEAHEIRDLPLHSSHDLGSYLTSLPGVLRDNSASLHVAGGQPQQSEYLLDDFEIGDPVSGKLASRINVDAVRSVQVDTGAYGAQYTHGGAAVMELNTYSGDDRWRFGATNFLPGLSLQQGVNLGNWYPRFTLSGPIQKGRAWFSDALSLQHTFSLISELPRPDNTTTQWSGDNLLRAQWNLTRSHILQANFLVNRADDSHLGLSATSPLSTTTNSHSNRYFVSLKDQLAFENSLFEFGGAFDKERRQSLPQGNESYVIAPAGTRGNYFETLRQQSRRWQSFGNLLLPEYRWHGLHTIRLGFNADHVVFSQQASRNMIQSEDTAGTTAQVTSFVGPGGFHLSNTQAGFFMQDAWQPFPMLLVQAGGRADWNRIIGRTLWAPRLAMNFMPFPDDRAKLTVAWGVYYQSVDLQQYSYGLDQQRADVIDGINGMQGPFVSRFVISAALQQPRFETTSLGWVEKFGGATLLNVQGIIRKESHGLSYEFQPSGQAFGGDFVLRNNRRDRYKAIEVSLQHSFGDAELFADYTRSVSQSNEVLQYTLENPLFAPQVSAVLPWDAPNRFISYGWTPIPIWKLLLSYHAEYRTGFPFGLVNQYRQLVGSPAASRFPDFATIDVGLEKRFPFHGHEWAVRLAVVNLTDRQNPTTVNNAIGGPLIFSGGQGRAFTARLRLVGRK